MGGSRPSRVGVAHTATSRYRRPAPDHVTPLRGGRLVYRLRLQTEKEESSTYSPACCQDTRSPRPHRLPLLRGEERTGYNQL